jgi:hypothetical protein
MTEYQALQVLDALVYVGAFQAADRFIYLMAGSKKCVAQMLELRLRDSMYQALMAEFALERGLSDSLAAFDISKHTGRFSRALTLLRRLGWMSHAGRSTAWVLQKSARFSKACFTHWPASLRLRVVL